MNKTNHTQNSSHDEIMSIGKKFGIPLINPSKHLKEIRLSPEFIRDVEKCMQMSEKDVKNSYPSEMHQQKLLPNHDNNISENVRNIGYEGTRINKRNTENARNRDNDRRSYKQKPRSVQGTSYRNSM